VLRAEARQAKRGHGWPAPRETVGRVALRAEARQGRRRHGCFVGRETIRPASEARPWMASAAYSILPPPGDEPPVREATHNVPLKPDAWPAKAARHQRELLPRPAGRQLNVPGWSADRGAEGTITSPPCIIPMPIPSSQHGAAPQGSQAGAHCGAIIGGGQGSARRPHGERNSMKLGRRQPELPPKQLLQPGAAARAERARARHNNRDMMRFSKLRARAIGAHAGRHEGMTRAASLRRRHRNPSSRFVTAPASLGKLPIFNPASSCHVVTVVTTERLRALNRQVISVTRGRDVPWRGLPFKEDRHVFIARHVITADPIGASFHGHSTVSTARVLHGRLCVGSGKCCGCGRYHVPRHE
jgi:hypothetical protein